MAASFCARQPPSPLLPPPLPPSQHHHPRSLSSMPRARAPLHHPCSVDRLRLLHASTRGPLPHKSYLLRHRAGGSRLPLAYRQCTPPRRGWRARQPRTHARRLRRAETCGGLPKYLRGYPEYYDGGRCRAASQPAAGFAADSPRGCGGGGGKQAAPHCARAVRAVGRHADGRGYVCRWVTPRCPPLQPSPSVRTSVRACARVRARMRMWARAPACALHGLITFSSVAGC